MQRIGTVVPGGPPRSTDQQRTRRHPRPRRRPAGRLGRFPQPAISTASSCCAPYLMKCTSPCTAVRTPRTDLVLRSKGGAITELTVPVKRTPPGPPRSARRHPHTS